MQSVMTFACFETFDVFLCPSVIDPSPIVDLR
jgi:hypothetical protein